LALVAQGQRTVDCYAMYRAARIQRTSSSNSPTVSSGFDHNDVDEEDDFAAQVDTSSPLDSGLTESQRLSCLLHDSEGRILKMASCLSLSIGSRAMLIQNVDTSEWHDRNSGWLCIQQAPGAHPILEKLDVSAVLLEPQLPVLLKSTKSFGTLQNTTSKFHRH
jgi:hypothetical protein